jgi:hypothetical protein
MRLKLAALKHSVINDRDDFGVNILAPAGESPAA